MTDEFVLLKDIDDIFQQEYEKMKRKLLKKGVANWRYEKRVFYFESIYKKLEKIKARIHRVKKVKNDDL